ncbi:MAG: GxxExxY protein [Planctomycetota bacterium]
MRHSDITEKIIGAFYRVYGELGYGFLERVYENSMVVALHSEGLMVEQQSPISVHFDGEVVGEYFADLLVNKVVIVELKAADAIVPAHEAQLLNYLKATRVEVGLLLNFGPEPKFKRKAMTTSK